MAIENEGGTPTDEELNKGNAETDGSLPDGGDDLSDLDAEQLLSSDKLSLDEKAELAFVVGVEKALPDGAKPKNDNASAPPAAAPAAAPVAGAPATEAAKPVPDVEVEKEIKQLGLKAKAAERFRELTSELASSKAMREAFTQAKIEKPEQLAQILDDAKFGNELNVAIKNTGASPEQFGQAFNVIGAMNSGRPELMGVALDAMVQECVSLAKKLGRDINFAAADPLEAHQDLKQAVELGETTREIALQLAHERATSAMRQQNEQRTQAENQQQSELSKAQNAAIERISVFGREQAAADATAHAARMQALNQTGVLDRIMKDYPVGRWESETMKAYFGVKLPAAAPPAAAVRQQPRVSHVPARGSNPAARMQAEPKDELDAFRMGVASVSPHLE